MQLPWQKPKIPVLALRGIIAPRPGTINLEAYTAPIERAFVLAKKSKNLVLAIESPGGSAVQSDLIGQFLLRRAKETGVAITAVIGDVGASGGYWLACAGAKIYANRLSIVGSIGVVTGGFGLDKFIARHGIERRVFTAGAHKRRLDMFAPLQPEDEAFTRELLDDAHGMFKAWVTERRGTRITTDHDKIFDGGYMLGERALSLGLIDGFGDVDTIVKQIGGKNAKPIWLRPKPPRGIMRFLTNGIAESALDIAEERLSAPTLR
ncbi:serine protease [Acidocella aquatica]|uniref:Serine protease n=1 Tax=Acidocella aquatica TaxID=1922313 RepID=A0ABQ6A7G8_9PROT|nr:S49 family peptidase [Acidocella aquatica]GLR68149.1 serine protease [Acidocella aquatica]